MNIMLKNEVFQGPILSTTYPIPKAPNISPNPRATIANIDTSNLSYVVFSGTVDVIIGTRRPVYTAIEIPVHAIWGKIGLIRFETSNRRTDFISSLNPYGISTLPVDVSVDWLSYETLLSYPSKWTTEKLLLKLAGTWSWISGILCIYFTGFLINRKLMVATTLITAIIS